MTLTKAKANDGEETSERPNADHWEQAVRHYPADAVGAGEARECQSCGCRFEIAMIAATEDTSSRCYEEFYKCLSCGTTASLRVHGDRPDNKREWVGRMDYPE